VKKRQISFSLDLFGFSILLVTRGLFIPQRTFAQTIPDPINVSYILAQIQENLSPANLRKRVRLQFQEKPTTLGDLIPESSLRKSGKNNTVGPIATHCGKQRYSIFKSMAQAGKSFRISSGQWR
jgi:hypothetical protein